MFQPHSTTVSPQCFTWFPLIIVTIRCPRPLSSSFLHPGRRALSACVQASHEDPGIWLHSGPDTPTHPLSTLAPCNAGVHTSCGRRWSSWGIKRSQESAEWNSNNIISCGKPFIWHLDNTYSVKHHIANWDLLISTQMYRGFMSAIYWTSLMKLKENHGNKRF